MKKYYFLALFFSIFNCNSTPLIFIDGFEPPIGSIQFITNESVLFDDAGDIYEFSVEVKNSVGQIINSGNVDWQVIASNNLDLIVINDRSVRVSVDDFELGSYTLKASHHDANATNEAVITLGELTPTTHNIPDQWVISGYTPYTGEVSTVILDKNSDTQAINPGDRIISGQSTGLLITVDSVNVLTDEVSITASPAKLTDVFINMSVQDASRKVSLKGSINGKSKSVLIKSPQFEMINNKDIINSFECKDELNNLVDLGLDGSNIDFDLSFDIKVNIDIQDSQLREFSIINDAVADIGVTTGTIALTSELNGAVTCSAEFNEVTTPPLFIYGFSFQVATTPILGFKLSAGFSGPNLMLTGPTGFLRTRAYSGIEFTSAQGWDYIDGDWYSYDYDLIEGEFNNDFEFSFSSGIFAVAQTSLNVSLGYQPFNIDLIDINLVDIKLDETLSIEMAAPLDSSLPSYTGPNAELVGTLTVTPSIELGSNSFIPLIEKIGIDLDFSLSFDPIIEFSQVHWKGSDPEVLAPNQVLFNVPFDLIVDTDNINDFGIFEVISSKGNVFSGIINNGTGVINWTPSFDDIGEHILYSRVSVDNVSEFFPYAHNYDVIDVTTDILVQDIVFVDSELAQCVWDKAVARNWYTVDKFKSLTCISATIESLDGIDELIFLEYLNLSNQNISDISPISSLTKLTYLNLSQNSISDISPLTNLINIEGLSLSFNSIINISPIINHTGLTEFSAHNNQIEDLTPIAGSTGLVGIDVSDNNIDDITFLSTHTDLVTLRVGLNPIEDISNLITLDLLETFYVYGERLIPCEQFFLFSYVDNFLHDSHYDVDGDGEINLPPEGVDQECN